MAGRAAKTKLQRKVRRSTVEVEPDRFTWNAVRLAELMRRHRLSRDEVAALVRVSSYTVDSWLRPDGTAAHRACQDAVIELLCLKLGDRVPRLDSDSRHLKLARSVEKRLGLTGSEDAAS